MKKALSILLALMLLLPFALPSVSASETALAGQSEPTTPKEQEFAQVLAWLMQDLTEENADQILTWDKETILGKLEGYDQPLEYNTKEEMADQLAVITGLFTALSSMGEEDGEGLAGLFGGLLGGEEAPQEGGSEGADAFSSLFGALMGGFTDDGMMADGEEESYEIDEAFNGTFWKNGDTKLESVWQDGYYKVAVTQGDTELSYLCQQEDVVDEAQEVQFSCLRGIGTGDEDTDKTQPDHGKASFLYDWRTDELIWKQADGTETVFSHIVDPLDGSQWFASGKNLTLRWHGEKNYEVSIETLGQDFTSWHYSCVLDESTDTLTGTGRKVSLGHADDTDAQATFAFQDARRHLVWTDEKEESAISGLTFTQVPLKVVQTLWSKEPYTLSILYADGYYDIHVFEADHEHAYLCTWDWGTSTFTALDPATLPFDSFSLFLNKELYTSTGSFVMEADNVMVWHDDAGLTGQEGIALSSF